MDLFVEKLVATDTLLKHNGFLGTVEMSFDDDCLHGKLLFINDLVTYEGRSPEDLKHAFIAAVDNYVTTCAANGVQPDKPCSGTFNVRISPDLHRAACIKAAADGTSLNDVVKEALKAAVEGVAAVVVNETHHHHYTEYAAAPFEESFEERPVQSWQSVANRSPKTH